MFTEQDTEELYLLTVGSRDHLRKWLSWLDDFYSLEHSLRYIRRSFESFASLGGFPTSFAIVYQGKIAGTIGFNHVSEIHRNASIGYWLGKPYEGKGIMSRSFPVVVDYGFHRLNLHRIEVRVATENSRSRAIPERFGFTQEGILREAEKLGNRYVDHVLYSMLAKEWQKT